MKIESAEELVQIIRISGSRAADYIRADRRAVLEEAARAIEEGADDSLYDSQESLAYGGAICHAEEVVRALIEEVCK